MDFDISGPEHVDDGAADQYDATDAVDTTGATEESGLGATFDRLDDDGDGIADRLEGTLDDGSFFVVEDYQQDGHADALWVDSDGDGNPDLAVTPNGDGSFNFKWDFAEDGSWASYETMSAQDVQAQFPELYEVLTTDVDPTAVDAVADYPPVEDGQIVGDPSQYSDDWFWQSFDGSCAPASVAMISAHYTGEDVTDVQFIEMANEQQLWANGSGEGNPGMYAEDACTLLNEAGIPAQVTYGSMDALDQALADGHGIMVAVDADEIWTGEGDDISDHMLAVAAIDYEAGIVYLSDTGTPDGDMEQVPLSVFEDAWEDSNYTMIECTQSAEEYQAEHGITDEPQTVTQPEPAPVEPTTEPSEPSEPVPGTPIDVEDTVVEVTQAPWLLLLINSGSLHPQPA